MLSGPVIGAPTLAFAALEAPAVLAAEPEKWL